VTYYFTAVETLVNVVLRVDPSELTAVTIAMDKNPAINAYSMAVAPRSSLINRSNRIRMAVSNLTPAVQGGFYLSAVATLVKVVFRLDPNVPTTVMIATEIPAAMRPYSMAVAPCSSVRNFFKRILICDALSAAIRKGN
jgi:hypothetical protein